MGEKERRLYDEFEMFCRWYCKYKGNSLIKVDDAEGYCDECGLYDFFSVKITPCDYCQIGEFIRHVRDVI